MKLTISSKRTQLTTAAAALFVALFFSNWLEASMARHMLLQLPLLVLAGWAGASALPPRGLVARCVARCDFQGIAGLGALLFVSAYWMIPRALELSLVSPWSEAAKIGSLLLLGLTLPGSLARCHWVVQLFFLGNFGAMMAIAGIEYQNLPQRLCNAYLLDDQNLAGLGLVTGAILISAAWCARIAPALSSPTHLGTTPIHELPDPEHRVDHHADTRIL